MSPTMVSSRTKKKNALQGEAPPPIEVAQEEEEKEEESTHAANKGCVEGGRERSSKVTGVARCMVEGRRKSIGAEESWALLGVQFLNKLGRDIYVISA